jgi:hypothetical protein
MSNNNIILSPENKKKYNILLSSIKQNDTSSLLKHIKDFYEKVSPKDVAFNVYNANILAEAYKISEKNLDNIIEKIKEFYKEQTVFDNIIKEIVSYSLNSLHSDLTWCFYLIEKKNLDIIELLSLQKDNEILSEKINSLLELDSHYFLEKILKNKQHEIFYNINYAYAAKKIENINLLIKYGIDITEDYLFYCSEETFTIVKNMINSFNINVKDSDGRNALYYAISSADIEKTNLLIKENIDINNIDNNNNSIFSIFLNKKADSNNSIVSNTSFKVDFKMKINGKYISRKLYNDNKKYILEKLIKDKNTNIKLLEECIKNDNIENEYKILMEEVILKAKISQNLFINNCLKNRI